MKKYSRRLTEQRMQAALQGESLEMRIRFKRFLDEIVVPLEARVSWLETPWWKRAQLKLSERVRSVFPKKEAA